MIIVTGGAGFIGSNIVRGLNEEGRTDILIVDDLNEGDKLVVSYIKQQEKSSQQTPKPRI